MQTINFCFGSTALSFCFSFDQILGLFCTFWAFRGYFLGSLGLFSGSRSDSKTFLEPANADYQFLFWKYSPIFLFFIWPNFGPFLHFSGSSGLFLGLGSGLKTFLGPAYID